MTVTASRSRPPMSSSQPHVLADEDVTGGPCFGFLHTIKIDDYPSGGQWR